MKSLATLILLTALIPAHGAEINNSSLYTGAVTTSFLGDGSVTTEKLSDGSVTTSKLNSDALLPITLDRANNRVGVNNTSPAYAVHLSSGIFYGNGTTAGINLQGVGSTTDPFVVGASTFVIKDSGELGLGTASPAYKMHVASGVVYNNGSTAGLSIQGVGSVTDPFVVGDSTFVLKASGRMGLGTASPAYKLHLASGVYYGDGATAGINLQGVGSTNDPFVVGASTFIIKDSGELGLGTASPAYKLHLASGIFYGDGTTAGISLQSVGGTNDPFVVGASTFIIKDSGEVGISETEPDGRLTVMLDSVLDQITYKYSGLTHGVTGIAETDTAVRWQLSSAGTSNVDFFTDTSNGPLLMRAIQGADGADANPLMTFRAGFKSGTSIGAADAGQVLFGFEKHDGTGIMDLTQDGNVGIGTDAPDQLLDVEGNAEVDSLFINNETQDQYQWGADAPSNGLFLYNSSDGAYVIQIDDTTRSTSINGPLTTTSSMTVTGGLGFYSRTIAQLRAITPGREGEVYYCSDCTLAGGRMVFSTGTSAGNFADADGSDWE